MTEERPMSFDELCRIVADALMAVPENERDHGIKYPFINESLESIMAGLDIRSEDRVLSVAGSGDQLFAFIETGCGAVAFDTNPDQVNYIRHREELLRKGDYEGFLALPPKPSDDKWLELIYKHCATHLEHRNRYFREEGRLDRIRANLDHFVIGVGNMFSLHKWKPWFSKMYLSNIIGYVPLDQELQKPDIAEIHKFLSKVTMHLIPGGLLYVTNGDLMENEDKIPQLPYGFELNPEKTRMARELEIDRTSLVSNKVKKSWYPLVLTKK